MNIALLKEQLKEDFVLIFKKLEIDVINVIVMKNFKEGSAFFKYV